MARSRVRTPEGSKWQNEVGGEGPAFGLGVHAGAAGCACWGSSPQALLAQTLRRDGREASPSPVVGPPPGLLPGARAEDPAADLTLKCGVWSQLGWTGVKPRVKACQ